MLNAAGPALCSPVRPICAVNERAGERIAPPVAVPGLPASHIARRGLQLWLLWLLLSLQSKVLVLLLLWLLLALLRLLLVLLCLVRRLPHSHLLPLDNLLGLLHHLGQQLAPHICSVVEALTLCTCSQNRRLHRLIL